MLSCKFLLFFFFQVEDNNFLSGIVDTLKNNIYVVRILIFREIKQFEFT